MKFIDGYRAKCEHGGFYRYSTEKRNWVAEDPESETGDVGCSQCLYLMLQIKQPKLLKIE